MGQTAIISPQILDSSAIGRDLITAATVASAHTTLDLEDTAFSYSLTQTFEAGIVTEAITSAANIVTTLPSGGQGQYYYGANPIYLMSATEFRPAEALTAVTLGSPTREWSNVHSVGGNFSGTVTANAFVGDGSGLTGLPGGNPFDQDLNTTDSPSFVGGTFTGTTTTDSIVGSNGDEGIKFDSNYGYLTSNNQGANVLRWAGSSFEVYGEMKPRYDSVSNFGSNSVRWLKGYFDDGSFTGNLDTEVGGSSRVYNLGSDGDTDTEYYETSWDTNKLKMYAKATGAGVVRDIQFGSASVQIDAKDATDQIVFRTGGAYRFQVSNTAVISTVDITPSTNGTLSNGGIGTRWSDVYSVDGDFSGTLTANTFESTTGSFSFTGNLNSEVGGSIRSYILGTDGDTDTEYLSVGAGTFGGYGIYATGTGAGATNQQLELLTNSRKSGLIAKADSMEIYANLGSYPKFAVTNASTYSRVDFRPHSTGNYACGTTTYRWSGVASVDGDFSGDVIMAANVDFTGLPTSDPSVAGRLWNDGGTLKISAG